MHRTWLEPHGIPVPGNFSQSIGGNPLVSQILVQRGITDPVTAKAFMDPNSYQPTSPLELPGVEKISTILTDAILR